MAVALVFSALFSSSEMALFSLNRAKILSFKNSPDAPSAHIYLLMENYHPTLIAIILGNMFVNSCVSMLNDELLSALQWSKAATTALAAVSGVVILLLFGEITPMTLAYAHALSWSRRIARPLYRFRQLISPLTNLCGKFCDVILDKLGRTDPVPLTPEEYLSYLDSCVAAGAFQEHQADLLREVFALRETRIGEVMRPRVDLTFLKISDPPDLVAEKIRVSKQSFLPVSGSDLESADSLLDSLAFFRLKPEERKHWYNSGAMLKNAPFLPTQTTLNKALAAIRERRCSAALVADEYGGLTGMISIRDIYSELAGESVETAGSALSHFKRLSGNLWIFNGGCPLDFVREHTPWKDCNKHNQYKAATLSGLFCEESGSLPEPGDTVCIDGFVLRALVISKNRIEKILLRSPGSGKTEERGVPS